MALWLLAVGLLIAFCWPAIVTGALPDSDDALRLAQVRDWIGGQGWYDLRQYRLDPPRGADIHWTRLVDLPLAALLLALTPLAGPVLATTITTTAVPLLTLLAALLLASAIGRRLTPGDGWLLTPVLLLMAGPALAMMTPGRIDHHGWQILALLAGVLGLVDERRTRGGLLAGAAIAASLAIGLEMLPYLAVLGACAALAWIADGREAPRLRALAASAAAGTLAVLLLFVPPAARWSAACDALSGIYLWPLLAGAAVMLAASFCRPATVGGRAGLAVLAALAMAAVLAAQGRQCLIDPYGAVDGRARILWLATVSEARPLFSQPIEIALACLALPAIGLAGALWRVVRTEGDARRGWMIVSALGAAAILLCLVSTRAGIAAQALAAPGAAALMSAGRARLARSEAMLVRVFGVVALFLCVSALGPRLAIDAAFARPAVTEADKPAPSCTTRTAVRALDALPPATLLTHIDQSAALVAHGRHRAIAGPYHRNGRAIADLMTAWAGDDATARAVIARHGVTLVALCGDPAEAQLYAKRNSRGLSARLMAGDAPGWLTRVPVDGTPWRIWRVD